MSNSTCDSPEKVSFNGPDELSVTSDSDFLESVELAGAIRPETLVNEHYQAVFAYAYRLAGNQPDAEDVTQQAFLSACRNLHQVKDFGKVKSWLLTIARNTYLKSKRHVNVSLEKFETELVDDDSTSAGDLDFDEERLSNAVSEMPETYRLPILMFYFEDIGYAEIAKELEVPIGTVMSRLSRGKAYLRSRLIPIDE